MNESALCLNISPVPIHGAQSSERLVRLPETLINEWPWLGVHVSADASSDHTITLRTVAVIFHLKNGN